MELINIDATVQAITLIAVAIIAGLFAFKKLAKDWLSSSAESNIIQLMHTELDRLSEQNTALSLELGRLHNELIVLNQELQKLTVENQRLQIEVMNLTAELNNFKQLRVGIKNGKI
jgi:predicted nuclease with TOPRIM domain